MDSSGWIEVFTRGPQVRQFRRYLDEADGILTPTIVIYEVYKIIRREASEDEADRAAARLTDGIVAPLDDRLALYAADLSLQHGLAMADAIVYATARSWDAVLVTGDKHFEGLPGVEYVERK